MSETVLRDILLVVLNNQFGPAGGEVFSGRGKTDIHMWHEKGAVFIAEYKFWKGAKAFEKATNRDDLLSLSLYLGYVTLLHGKCPETRGRTGTRKGQKSLKDKAFRDIGRQGGITGQDLIQEVGGSSSPAPTRISGIGQVTLAT